MMNLRGALGLVGGLGLLAFGSSAGSPRSRVASEVALEQTSFLLPGDGQPNNNGSIGPFCCTGHTAIIRAVGGYPVAYVYFFDFEDAVMTSNTSSAAASMAILVSATTNASDPNSPQERGDIFFSAQEMQPGSSRTRRVGELYFTARIEHVATLAIGNRSYFDMGSASVRVTASFSPPEEAHAVRVDPPGVRVQVPSVRVQVSPARGANCSLRPDAGPCKAEYDRYFYDAGSGRCRVFSWGGCEGVVPFETREECIAQCERR